MAVTLPFGVNFRQAEAYMASLPDPAPNYWSSLGGVTGGGGATYSGAQGFGWTDISAFPTNAGVANRDSGLDHRLAGISYNAAAGSAAGFEYRVDTGNGTFSLTLAIGDGGDAQGPHKIEVFDGTNTTAIFSITTATGTTLGQWYDASGVLRTSASAWISSNVPASITVANAYIRIRIGGASGQTTLSHFRLDAAPTLTYSRPSSDISNTGWVPSTGTDLFAVVDETTSNRTDYMSAFAPGVVGTLATLPARNQPPSGEDMTIAYDAQGVYSVESVKIELLDGTTVIKDSGTITLGAAATGTITITAAEWAAVSAWPWAPRLRVTSL